MSYYPASKCDKWQTPRALYAELDREFAFDCDPCPLSWQPGDPDGLQVPWGACSFVNPPYSQTAAWIAKAHSEWKLGKTVVMLLNCITDTAAFHDYVLGQAEVRFLRGRLKFLNPLTGVSNSNVRPSMVVVFRGSSAAPRADRR